VSTDTVLTSNIQHSCCYVVVGFKFVVSAILYQRYQRMKPELMKAGEQERERQRVWLKKRDT